MATVTEVERELLRTLQTHKETLSGEVHELHARLRTALPQEELLDEIDHVEVVVIAGMRLKSPFKDLLFKYLQLSL